MRPRSTISTSLVVAGASWVVAAAIIGWAAIFGPPQNAFAVYSVFAALVIALLTMMHVLVTRVLPVSRARLRRAPGISVHSVAPGVPGVPPRIDIHLDDSKRD
jgi:hypothetical protein